MTLHARCITARIVVAVFNYSGFVHPSKGLAGTGVTRHALTVSLSNPTSQAQWGQPCFACQCLYRAIEQRGILQPDLFEGGEALTFDGYSIP